MSFSERAKTIALAIIKIFETSKPFGDYSACVVLNDGAGISYGTSQFTHKSGSLAAVIQRCIDLGRSVPQIVLDALPDFRSGRKIPSWSANNSVKAALRVLGKTPEMQQAQREIAFEKYLKPALDACAGSGFVLPLSLAVIYDSMNHGSWAKIRDRVSASDKNERAWITEYVRDRDAWLESVPRLAPTDYRTDFFLAQIARGNWNMNLPLNVHGYQLTENLLFPRGSNDAEADTASAAANSQPEEPVAPAGSVPDAQATTAEEMQPPAISVPPSPPNKTDVVVEKEPDVVEVKPKGFFGSLWQKVTGAFGGGVTADVAIEKAQQAQTLGLSERTWGFIFWAIIAGLAIWIVYHFVVQKVVPWGRWILGRMRTNQLVAGNATADSVQVISADKLAEYEAKGYLVVRRS